MKEELEVRTSLVLGRFSFLHIGQCALRRAICLHVIFIFLFSVDISHSSLTPFAIVDMKEEQLQRE
jgi:hypothetical protein